MGPLSRTVLPRTLFWPGFNAKTRLPKQHAATRCWTNTRSLATAATPRKRKKTNNIPQLSDPDRKTWNMGPGTLSLLKVNKSRLMDELHRTCQWGTGKPWINHTTKSRSGGGNPTETGMSRLALSDSDKQGRDWFVDTTRSLGCEVKVDAMGNIFAIRPGSFVGSPTYAGSHLDTQPSGGRYDGILGILAGVEMLRVLDENKIVTAFPVGVVNWTNEEGARFAMSMVSSGVWAGAIPLEHAHNLKDVGGTGATMKSELERIGYLGHVPASHLENPMGAHFELHIEQGPVLEAEKQKIGVVTGVQAYRWYTVEVVGREAHTGTTPFSVRQDALLSAARMIAQSHIVATRNPPSLASTGILSLEPGSVNTIPGKVTFSLDIRSPQDSIIETIETQLIRDFAFLASPSRLNGLTTGLDLPAVNWSMDSDSPATNFDPDCISTVRAAAVAVTGSESLVRDMVSGAGHDSVYASWRCPTSMIFVPSRDGVSHHPEEYTAPKDCAIGAEVLMQSVLRYDQLRYERYERCNAIL